MTSSLNWSSSNFLEPAISFTRFVNWNSGTLQCCPRLKAKMTTFVPRSPYSEEELRKLYPEGLQLQLVQVLLRHGERSPVSARFQNAGLAAYWPYCAVARQMISATYEGKDGKWSDLQWRRRIETFGNDDGPVMAAGPKGEVDAVCNLGELTDKGRETTWNLGRRLRKFSIILFRRQAHCPTPTSQTLQWLQLTFDQVNSTLIS